MHVRGVRGANRAATSPRRARTLVAAVAGAVLVAGCTSSVGDPLPAAEPTVPAAVAGAPGGARVLDGPDAVALALQASRAVWRSSPVAVTALAGEGTAVERAAELASELAVPLLLVDGPASEEQPPSASPSADGASADATAPGGPTDLAAELGRLGVTHALHVGPSAPALAEVQVVADPADLPEFRGAAPVAELTALTAPKAARGRSEDAALASLAAAGARVVTLADPDPRVTPGDVEAMAGTDAQSVIGVGAGFGPDATFTQRVEVAATGVQLPGGGQTVFDDKRYVALYGHPRTGGLGVLGEQGPKASVTRARRVAAQYEPHAKETIVPAFEIIATVATGGAGPDGDYSNEWDVEVLRPLVDRAARSGVYVVLDLQSGREDFLSQAKLYEELLVEPHVGLAMDPEWRLAPGEKPLQQIGSVSAAELNEAIDWLAELTDRNDLPQKMVLLHQFRTAMITDRPDLHLDHDELAVIVQMDGDGTLGQKLGTWNALRADAPPGLRFGWKNFYDEDEPTPSPAATFQVRPKPWWVSYQ